MIKHNLRQLTALLLLLICASSASAWDVYTSSFASGNWWQEVGYAGVGNKNEVLAVAEVNPCPVSTSDVVVNANEVGTIPSNGTFQSYTVTNVTVNSIVDPKLTVQFRLKGVAADADYVGKVKLWARKYDATAQSSVSGSSQVANTFAYPFDYRDPVGKSGAILLYETSNIHDGVYTCEIDEELNGNYVLYITADVKDFDTNPSAGMLPLLTVAKTELGAEFISIQSSAKSVDYTAIYDYTYSYTYWFSTRTGTVTDKTKTGTASNVSSSMTLARQGKPANLAPNGSRVLVPQRKVLFTPGDFYSKYYRIPALAKASDGSLIAISDARKYHIHDVPNNIDMVARRSTDGGKTWSLPITIAKGTGPDEITTSNCSTSRGYGDAAIAALPNGDLIVTMIYGNGLHGTSSTFETENYYCLSHDNGQSWDTPKPIPASTYVIDGHSRERGCIAPGNMCVVKNGPLKDKVIACFRSYSYNTGDGNATYNIFLLYDPKTDSWSRLTVNNGNYYKIGADDEAHLVEVGENTFLMSIRQSKRAYAKVTYNPETNVLTATDINHNVSLGTACNGDMLNYTTKAGHYYQIHSLPVRGLNSVASGSNTGRNGLKLFYSQYTGEGNLNATMTTPISDPYDISGQTISGGDSNNTYRAETSQYSSLTLLSDGSIGIYFEEYPQVIRVETGGSDGGDFLMEDVYMNLRIGDIIPGEEAPEAPQLKAPRITPTDRSYDSHQPTDRPNPITIYNDNEEVGVTTHYTIYFYDMDGHQASTSISGNFTGASIALDWSTLTLGNQTLEDMVKDKRYPGVSIRVIAYCTKDGYKDSESVAQPYLFSTPVRNVKIVAKPVSGWGTPFISAFNIGTYEQDQVMVASVGATLVANGTPVYPYSFKGFSFNGDQYVDIREGLTYDELQALNIQDIHDYQITMTVPYESDFNIDGKNEIVIYAWYEANNDFGVKTRVLNNYYSSFDDEDKPYYFRNDWYPNLYMASEDFPEPDVDLIFDNVNLDKKDNAVPNPIYYNLNPQKIGLDLNVEIMPDNRGMMGYNAIVMVKNVDGDYVKVAAASSGSMAKAPAGGSRKYFLLQGKDAPFAEGSAVYDGATAVQNWYEESAYGILPVHVKGIAFNQVVAKNVSSEQAAGACNFNVEIYFVRGNSLTNVEELTNGDNYVTRVIHPIRLSNNPATGVQDNMVTRTVKSVRYFNLAGMVSNTPFAGINIVVTDYTDGTRVTNKVVK